MATGGPASYGSTKGTQRSTPSSDSASPAELPTPDTDRADRGGVGNLMTDSQGKGGVDKMLKPKLKRSTTEFDLHNVLGAALLEGQTLIHTPLFNGIVGFAVALNAILMGIEIDYSLGMFGIICEHLFTVIWSVEMVLRMYYQKFFGYFRSKWNQMDFLLAWLSIFDAWILPWVGANNDALRRLSVLRVLRIIRIVRLVKVLRSFHELWLLVNGLITALTALSWVLLLVIIIIYVGGLFMATVVGTECGAEGVYAEFGDCEDMFGTMLGSMYTLFQVLTLESWSMAVARPVMKEKPWLVIFFILFLYLTTFGLMNIVMGVIVEQVIQASKENEEKVKRQKEARQRNEIKILCGIFEEADKDGGGTVDAEEFATLCKRKDVQKIFEDLELPVSRQRLAMRLFEVLDGEGHGEMKIHDFLEATTRLKNEGRGLIRDPTLLLMDVRYLGRRINRLEKELLPVVEYLKGHIPGLQSTINHASNSVHSRCEQVADGSSKVPDTEDPDKLRAMPIAAQEPNGASSPRDVEPDTDARIGANASVSTEFVALKSWLDSRLNGITEHLEGVEERLGTRLSILEAKDLEHRNGAVPAIQLSHSAAGVPRCCAPRLSPDVVVPFTRVPEDEGIIK